LANKARPRINGCWGPLDSSICIAERFGRMCNRGERAVESLAKLQGMPCSQFAGHCTVFLLFDLRYGLAKPISPISMIEETVADKIALIPFDCINNASKFKRLEARSDG